MPRRVLLFTSIIAALALFACAPEPVAESTPEPAALEGVSQILILHKGGSSLGVYSPEGEQVAAIEVGPNPHEMVLSADGSLLYCTDNGTMAIEEAGEGNNTISVVDLASRKRVGVVDLGKYYRPHGIAFNEHDGLLYVSTENPDQLLAIDPKELKVIREYDTQGETAHLVTLGPEGKWAYVSHSRSGDVGAVELETGEVKRIEIGGRPAGSALSPDGKLLYVANRESDEINIIDIATKEAVGAIPTSPNPARLRVVPDGTIVYALSDVNAVGFADPEAREEVATVPIGGRPVSLDITEDGRYAFASAQADDTVYVISVPDREVVAEIHLPEGMGPDPVIALP